MEKINVAELLKDCPKGMELYSPLCGKCVFDRLNRGTIICKKQNTQEITFTSEGYYMLPVFDNCECMIFPSKDQRDWSKFHRPFKDGDIVYTIGGSIAILSDRIGKHSGSFHSCCGLFIDGLDTDVLISPQRLATEEEKQKLFQAIKENGYKWNAETKTLEKLIEPKFKVGDKVRHKTHIRQGNIVTEIKDTHYILDDELALPFISQDNYELVPNKFDITTLKPFDKELVRDFDNTPWEIELFSRLLDGKHFKCFELSYVQCIPYERNEHLLGKKDDCDEYFNTWK